MDGYQYTAVAMGALDAPTGMNLSKHTFVGDKGDYYEIVDGVPQSDSFLKVANHRHGTFPSSVLLVEMTPTALTNNGGRA